MNDFRTADLNRFLLNCSLTLIEWQIIFAIGRFVGENFLFISHTENFWRIVFTNFDSKFSNFTRFGWDRQFWNVFFSLTIILLNVLKQKYWLWKKSLLSIKYSTYEKKRVGKPSDLAHYYVGSHSFDIITSMCLIFWEQKKVKLRNST